MNGYIKNAMLKAPDKSKKLHIIVSGTGTGKTSYLFNKENDGFLSYVQRYYNRFILPCQILILVPRTGILKQLMRKYADSGFLIMTVQNYVEQVEQGVFIDARVIVIDEIHLLPREASFVWQNGTLLQMMKSCPDTVFFGLTATDDELDELLAVDGIEIDRIQKRVIRNYKVLSASVISSNKVEQELVDIAMKASPNLRIWIQVNDAKMCRKLANKFENAAWICSKTNEKYGTLMNREVYDYIIENERLPDDIYLCFVTCALEVGVNLNDDRIKEVVVVSNECHRIEQVVGRNRRDLKHLTVINPYVPSKQLSVDVDKLNELLDWIGTNFDGNIECDGAQKHLEWVYLHSRNNTATSAALVIRSIDGRYMPNLYIQRLYELSFEVANSTNYYKQGNERELEEHFCTLLRPLISGDIEFEDRNADAVEIRRVTNAQKVAMCDISQLIDKELCAEQLKKLGNDIGLVTLSNGSKKIGIPTIRNAINDTYDYVCKANVRYNILKDGKRTTRTFYVITKAFKGVA